MRVFEFNGWVHRWISRIVSRIGGYKNVEQVACSDNEMVIKTKDGHLIEITYKVTKL